MMLEIKNKTEILKIFRTPYLLGICLAFFVVAGVWPSGFDASLYYLRYPPTNATVPVWVYFLTYPLSLVGWPLSWQILVVTSVLIISIVYAMRGNQRWWLVIASSAFIYNAWWGQIEVFSVIGLALSMLVLKKKIPSSWLGIAWLLMIIKPQVNYGLVVLFIWWIWRNQGARFLVPPTIVFISIVTLSFILFPGWLERLTTTLQNLQSGESNATLWPWGLIVWPMALLPIWTNPFTRMRLVAAATLLGSPYFTLHHCVTLLVLTDHPYGLLLSWIPFIMIIRTRDWGRYAWVIPIGILLIELARMGINHYKGKSWANG